VRWLLLGVDKSYNDVEKVLLPGVIIALARDSIYSFIADLGDPETNDGPFDALHC
jgi:hypothetical protein